MGEEPTVSPPLLWEGCHAAATRGGADSAIAREGGRRGSRSQRQRGATPVRWPFREEGVRRRRAGPRFVELHGGGVRGMRGGSDGAGAVRRNAAEGCILLGHHDRLIDAYGKRAGGVDHDRLIDEFYQFTSPSRVASERSCTGPRPPLPLASTCAAHSHNASCLPSSQSQAQHLHL